MEAESPQGSPKSAAATHLGENFDLRDLAIESSAVHLMSLRDAFGPHLAANAEFFERMFRPLHAAGQLLYHRRILSPIDTRVRVWDEIDGVEREMLMFGSNNYLGFANDLEIRERVIESVRAFGIGMAGPMILNGSSALHQELEERLASFKRKEAAMVLPTGYQANLAWVTTLMTDEAMLFYDEASHASLIDAVRLGRKKAFRFSGQDLATLETLLKKYRAGGVKRDIFVAMPGVYSMSGEIADLRGAADLCERYGAMLVIDDAHGTGILGEGRGTAEHLGVADKVFLCMGTFSKSFAVTGGFLAGDRKIVNFMRFFARTYFFTASLSPMIVSAVLAGLEIIQKNPARVSRSLENAERLRRGLDRAGLRYQRTSTAIVPVLCPEGAEFRDWALDVHRSNLFVNPIEPPAVPLGSERFRVSVMATHTDADIDGAVAILSEAFARGGRA